MKKNYFLIIFLIILGPLWLFPQQDKDKPKNINYLKQLERELSEEEKFLENIIGDLIAKGNKDFIETLVYRMGYEKAKDKVPRLFFPIQFGGGQMVSAGVGIHIYNRQFYVYFTGGYTDYGKYKDFSGSFITEVKLIDLYFYKRSRIDFLLGSNISFFSEPGAFIASVAFKQIYYIHGLFFNPYTVFNLFFDKTDPIYQIGIGINLYPWG